MTLEHGTAYVHLEPLAAGKVTTEPCVRGHHAYEWALAAVLENPNLTDAEGRCIVDVDGVDYVTPEVGDPYIHVRTIFTMDANGEYVLTSDGMDVERTSIDLKIWKPAELTVEADD
ncbi:MAG: hypothetical protein WBA38_04150 [Gordonia sp. (in: high G+C Gram-positive bacteria)]|uniref:hypothetical protein n=1 Tax=Gordonia sp. (in: high G+C Gram-positive bacteria) TaxID=84139 RepID=UPI003C727774